MQRLRYDRHATAGRIKRHERQRASLTSTSCINVAYTILSTQFAIVSNM